MFIVLASLSVSTFKSKREKGRKFKSFPFRDAARTLELNAIRARRSRPLSRRNREIGDGRLTFFRRRGEQMEMELQARAEGSQLALGSSDDRLRKGARVVHGNNTAAAGAVAHGRQHNRVAIRWTGRRRINGENVAPPGQPCPREESRGEVRAGERRQRRATSFVRPVVKGCATFSPFIR